MKHISVRPDFTVRLLPEKSDGVEPIFSGMYTRTIRLKVPMDNYLIKMVEDFIVKDDYRLELELIKVEE